MLGSVYINRVRTKDLKQMILDQHQNEELKESIEQVGICRLQNLAPLAFDKFNLHRLCGI